TKVGMMTNNLRRRNASSKVKTDIEFVLPVVAIECSYSDASLRLVWSVKATYCSSSLRRFVRRSRSLENENSKPTMNRLRDSELLTNSFLFCWNVSNEPNQTVRSDNRKSNLPVATSDCACRARVDAAPRTAVLWNCRLVLRVRSALVVKNRPS